MITMLVLISMLWPFISLYRCKLIYWMIWYLTSFGSTESLFLLLGYSSCVSSGVPYMFQFHNLYHSLFFKNLRTPIMAEMYNCTSG